MYAVIETGGKQFKVEKDAVIQVPRMNAEVGMQVEFDSVLLHADERDISVGAPHVPNAKVIASILAHKKDDKIIVFKMKRRKGYRRKKGHCQNYTELHIQDIVTTNETSHGDTTPTDM